MLAVLGDDTPFLTRDEAKERSAAVGEYPAPSPYYLHERLHWNQAGTRCLVLWNAAETQAVGVRVSILDVSVDPPRFVDPRVALGEWP